MEGGTHKGKSAKGLQNPECCPVFLKEHVSGSTNFMKRECFARSEQSFLVTVSSFGPVLGRTGHSCFWPLSQNEKQKKTLWEGSGGLQLDKKRAGVDSTGPRAWRGLAGQQCPRRRQCVCSWQSRAQLRPFRNKYCFRPKCVDLRKLTFPWQCRLFRGSSTLTKGSLRSEHSLEFAFKLGQAFGALKRAIPQEPRIRFVD